MEISVEERTNIIREAYDASEDLRNYLDAYAVGRGKPVEECFKDATVFEVYKQYFENWLCK